MEIKFETNKNLEFAEAEKDRQLINAARKEIIRLRELTGQAKKEGKTQDDEPLLQYAPDFENINLDLIDIEEADFLDKIMNSSSEEDYYDLVDKVNKYRKKTSSLSSEAEKKSHNHFLNYIGNKALLILQRLYEKEDKKHL